MPLLILIAAIVGVAVALQGQFMGAINHVTDTSTSMFVTYCVGGIVAIITFFARREPVRALVTIPWYSWSAGLLGLIIVGGVSYVAPRLGLSRTLVITVAAQLLAAVLIDQFGWFNATQRHIDVTRAVGLALTIGGVWLVVKP
jgi:bacterial/archaeal transporter family-2 protein